jgi:Fe-S cluster assembly iron-binding protein IscA
LNELLRDTPKRPQTITVTRAAAMALEKILHTQCSTPSLSHPSSSLSRRERKKCTSVNPIPHGTSPVLSVEMDHAGNFCMEFRDKPHADDRMFRHADVPSVCVVASPAALLRVGGATIDFREERFKLDLPAPRNSKGKVGCGHCGDGCACKKAK